MRRLNHIWGQDLKPLDPGALRKKLRQGLTREKPGSSLACCLAGKKTIRIGNRADAFQPIEKEHRITKEVIKILEELWWSYVIQTRFMSTVEEYAHCYTGIATFLPVISPGLEKDWETLERGRTDPPRLRLEILQKFQRKGYQCGVNGEPFIPGFHTVDDFEDTIKLLKEYGVKSYNTYNLHFNDFVAKRLHAIGLDIERIWEMNQDKNWKPVQQKLCDIAKKHNIILGCPDFVNTGPEWRERANTCCGIQVQRPSLFNTHHFKKCLQDGLRPAQILQQTWEGIGDFEKGNKILSGTPGKFYTMADAGLIPKKKKGLIE